jgi:hypothetical protein
MATLEELKADAAAFQSWAFHMLEVMGKSFYAMFIPASAWMNAATAVVTAAEKSPDQSTSGRQTAGVKALRASGHRRSMQRCRGFDPRHGFEMEGGALFLK